MEQIEIYKSGNSEIEIRVQFEKDTVWLTQKQIAMVFGTEVPAINKHIKNLIKEGELIEQATVSKMEIVQEEGKRRVNRSVDIYNLDMIISVGYRVNSGRATQFRIWATQRLKDYLIKGYAINQQRLEQLNQIVSVIQQSGTSDSLQLKEAKGLLEILGNYTQSFILLNQYDSNNLSTEKLNENITYEIKYKEAKAAITELKTQLIEKKEATELFGNEKDNGFNSSLQSVVQTFDGNYLYASIEEQAAHLLYFIIKNHSFNDGNKRIGAFLFIWFLEKNKHRFKKSGELKINDNALVALALLVAQSNPDDKDVMIKLVINLIKG